MSLPFGSFVDACDSPTVTFTSTILDEPSLKVTFTFPVYSPVLFTSIVPAGVTSVTVAPSGRFLMLSVRSYFPPKSTVSASASTFGIGVMILPSIVTFTFTLTSSVDPSG